MAKEIMLWSKDALHSVRASKMREFSIQVWNTFEGNKFRLIGKFGKTDEFEFGIFDTIPEATSFLLEIHGMIEGKGSGSKNKGL